MKLTLFLSVMTVFQLWATETYSQMTKLTLKLENVKISEALNEIESQSEFFFLYSPKLIDVERKVNIDAEKEPIKDILSNIFDDKVIFSVIDRQIILTPSDFNYHSEAIQQQKITGKVIDEKGNPIGGVTVLVKGTTTGTLSDATGKYIITNLPKNATLIFSFIGMVTQEIPINGQMLIDVVLKDVAVGLDEVIIVGYGTQKKLDITGSVSNIGSEALDSKNVTKGSLALVGEMSGVSVRQLSGNPIENEAQITIRGLGTFSSAGNNPLVLVDGIESSLDNVDPNDIKSISVLKDAASASIYGSKAANGVILLETKKGISGAPKFSFYSYVGKQAATEYPQMVDSWDYATAYNEGLTNLGQTKRFTDQDIQKYKSGTDPAYPNFNHMKYLWTSGSGLQTKTGINISGGTPVTQYLFSAGYLNQEGIVMKNFTKRYDARLNLNTKLMDKVKLNVNLFGNTSNGNEPSGAYDQGINILTMEALRMTNILPGAMPGGYWGSNETIHPEADLNSASFVGNKNTYVAGNADLTWDIFKDLKISGTVGYTYGITQNKWFRATYPVTPTYSVFPNFLSESWLNNTALTLQSLIEYNKLFGDHLIHILGGFSQQRYYGSYLNAYRDNLPNNEITEIDAGSVTNATNGGGGSENKLRSYFGRVNYSYLDKYLLEANIRYDGSSRFPQEHRYGLFPSFSVGWRMSKENFFQNSLPWIYDFKIRGSWGELGNQSIGDYPYQSLISLGQNYPFGNSLTAGAAVTTIPNTNITWERTRITDGGFDLSLIKGKLALTADYFVKTTFDILYNVSVSTMLGASPSPDNAGKVQNKGWDFNLSYKNSVGDFSYGVSANFSLVNNKVISLANVNQDIDKGLFIGYPIGSSYGYIADGLFIDQADISSYPGQPYDPSPGEIRFKDISGPNGVPDGIVNDLDRTVIGTPLPKSTYGFSLTGKYKGFDLSMLFQGEGGRNVIVSPWYFYAFDNDGNIQKWEYEQRWNPENPSRNAGYPRMDISGSNSFTYSTSTFWLRNATFLRLKNVEVGYNLPSEFAHKLRMDNVRIYVSGENLFTISHFYQGWDPEMLIQSEYGWYPLTRLLLAGIKIDF